MKIFISYAQKDINEEKLENLIDILEENNFEIIIDRKKLEAVSDLTNFMETSIRESDYTLVLCTPEYKKRADDRENNSTGVGYEARILATKISNNAKNIIPILFDNTEESIPDFLKGLIYIDLTFEIKNKNYIKKIDELLKKIGIKKIKFNENFKKELNSTEIFSNTHNKKENLTLEDIFVYPRLSYIEEGTSIQNKDIKLETLKSSKIIEKIEEKKYILISGDNQSGKSTLSKKLTFDALNRGLIPILINKTENLKNNLERSFKFIIKKQYIDLEYDNENIDKYLIIVDDFHLLNNKDNILKRLLKYKYVILLTDDIYNLDMKKQEIAQFKKFRILEFTAKLRKKLIQKWSDIYDETESANLRYKKNDEREEMINSTIGKVFNNGIMPAYPFFILSVLISNEILGNLDPNITSQGHCYQALIYISLRKIGIREKEIDMYLNFLTELSYHIFKENIFELYSQDMEEFLEKYNDDFNMSVDSSKIIENLLKSKILIKTSFGSIKFLYPYLYYYFIGKYLSEHYLEEEKTINKIVGNLHTDRNSYICIFISHHSKEKKLLDELIINSLIPFESYSVITLKQEELDKYKLEFDEKIDEFLPKIEDPIESREKKLEIEDKTENIEINEESLYKEYNDETDNADEEYNYRKCIRTVEVIGNLVRNRHGSLPKEILKDLMKHSIYANLRIIDFIFKGVSDEEFKKYMLELIENAIKKLKIKGKNSTQILAKSIYWKLNYNVIIFIIYKTIRSIGSENLIKVIKEISKEEKNPAMSIVKNGIMMWYLKEINLKEIIDDFDKYNYSEVAKYILKYLVMMYSSTHIINYKERQQLSSKLGIPERKIF